jgi:type II secretory pathway pseudopilin PulG
VTRPPAHHPARRAVALIDALVASIILGIALAAIIGLGSQAVRAQGLGERLQTAAMLADEQLSLVLARGPDDYQKRFGLSGACDPPFEDYRFELTFGAAAPSGSSAASSGGGTGGQPYKVRVAIVFQHNNASREVVVETLIAPRLGQDPDPDRRPETAVERIQ